MVLLVSGCGVVVESGTIVVVSGTVVTAVVEAGGVVVSPHDHDKTFLRVFMKMDRAVILTWGKIKNFSCLQCGI